MSLAADPAACTIPAAGGNSTHQLANSGAEKLVFKEAQEDENIVVLEEFRRTMSLAADPAACTVPASGGNSTHQLANSGAEKLVFKVKSSNNNEYRIKPVFGFVEPGASTPLEVTRLAGAPKEDKLVIQFGPAPADATDATAAFNTIAAAPAGTITLPLSATA